MKAQTLALCIPSDECDKNCPYCISKMTWSPEIDVKMWIRNLPKVVNFAELAQVTDVIVTGKGEPVMQAYMLLHEVSDYFHKWPLILQTDGWLLSRSECLVEKLSQKGYNIIAVSIDHPSQIDQNKDLWRWISEYGMIPRITVMVTEAVTLNSPTKWVEECQKYGIRQLSFRRITVPDRRRGWGWTEEAIEVADWIRVNVSMSSKVEKWFDKFKDWIKLGVLIRRLCYGAEIREFHDVAVTYFDYCIQDENGDDDIRSLIYNQDGHLYTTWSSPASLIF